MPLYRDAIKAYHNLIRKARAEHFANKMKNSSNPSKTIFSLLKDMMKPPSDSESFISTNSQCEELAKFFIEKVEQIYDTFDPDIKDSDPYTGRT